MMAKLKRILKISFEYLTAILLIVAYIMGHVIDWKNTLWLILGIVWACVATWDLIKLIRAEKKLKQAEENIKK